MIKIKLRLAAEDIKWKKRTGERKQTKFHQNVAFVKDQKIVAKQDMFNSLLICLLSVPQKDTEAFPLKNIRSLLTKY